MHRRSECLQERQTLPPRSRSRSISQSLEFTQLAHANRYLIIEPWKKQKSVRAFHDREPGPASKSKVRDVNEGQIIEQRTSMLLTRLPVEIRLCIYKMVILDGGTHWHLTEYRNASEGGGGLSPKHSRNSLWSFRSNIARMRQASVSYQISLAHEFYYSLTPDEIELYHSLTPHEVSRELLHGGFHSSRHNGLSIIRTCRHIYLETIPILYGQYHSFHAALLLT